jgi:DNA gyrase subunit B
VSSDVKAAVTESVVSRRSSPRTSTQHPKPSRKTVVGKAVAVRASAREAARLARDAMVRRKSALEGDLVCLANSPTARSATPRSVSSTWSRVTPQAAPPSRAATRKHQAILPLRGKILNVEKVRSTASSTTRRSRPSSARIGTGFGHRTVRAGPKLRYGKVIVMTDADVDGSHIRTLLLTLFYRKMPELVMRGHVYVAQPPLYKIKKGKFRSSTSRTRARWRRFFLDSVCHETILRGTAGGAPVELTGDALAALVGRIGEQRRMIEQLDKKVDARIGAVFAEQGLDDPDLADEAKVRALGERTAAKLAGRYPEMASLEFEVRRNAERGNFELRVGAGMAGVRRETVIGHKLVNSPEFETLRRLYAELRQTIAGPFTLVHGDDEPVQLNAVADIATTIDALGRKGLQIQRYKGLGEMNAEQLWETTMDPEKRNLLRVKVEELAEADQIFTKLMGDLVEPRREFIEQNALNVRNLDV